MLLLSKLWNNSPKAVLQALTRKLTGSTIKPKWTEVKSGPLKGGKLFLDADSFVGWNEMINGRFDSFIYDEIARRCHIEDSVFWDIGAHFGYHSFAFASLVGDNGHVYSFEPNPFNAARFQMHLDENKTQAKRITLNTFALSDVNGEMTLIFSNDVDGSSSSGSHLQNVSAPLEAETYNSFIKQTVITHTIDSYINSPGVRTPDIIKIDVEGAELLVLKGGKDFFKNHMPMVFMEVHNILMMFKIYEFFSSINYELQILDESNSTLSKCFILANPKQDKNRILVHSNK